MQILAAANALHRQHKMDDGQLTDLGIAYWSAFDNHMRKPTGAQWGVLASAMNVGVVLAERGAGCPDVFVNALEGLQRAKERAEQGKSWALDGDCIAAVRVALEHHDLQMKECRIIEVSSALNEVRRRVQTGAAYGA